MKNMYRLTASVVARLGAGILMMVALVGCEGSGSGSAGNSTVQGNVKNFSSSTDLAQAYRMNMKANTSASMAEATPAGVTVALEGTDLVATTDDDGQFVITGVPAGSYVLVLTYNGVSASYSITVPDNATIKLDDIQVINGIVSVAEIEVEDMADDDDQGDDDSDDDDSDDDDSDDDDADDDDSDDDDQDDDDSGDDD